MYSYIWKTSSHIAYQDYKSSFQIEGIVPLMWREHCLECAMPMCYKTCDLYYPRMDKRCLRFENGIVPLRFTDNCIRGAEIHFRRWAKLQTNLTNVLMTVGYDQYEKKDRLLDGIGRFFRKCCDIMHHYRLCQVYASLAERYNTKTLKKARGGNANYFIATINNKQQVELTLLLEIISDDKSIYKTSFVLKPGWNEYSIPIAEINLPFDYTQKNYLRAYLNQNETGILQFRYFDFVKLTVNNNPLPAKKVKCVSWDLDNTLWDGVIGDVGKEKVKINQNAIDLIKQLDERGIIQTITSKNTYENVWPFLEELGIDHFFLYPAINWGRKSHSLLSISKELNINIDTFALIDDSSFERIEVKSELPQVRVFDVTEIPDILRKPEFNVEVSPETRGRRLAYQIEAKRKIISASWGGDYNSFLKSCEMRMRIFNPTETNGLDRCLELINRSNQYNISGNRYTKEEFVAILCNRGINCYAISVSDKYGDYGIVGFASIDNNGDEISLIDFVMSCRVAQKKVERAFINEIICSSGADKFVVVIKKTDRNKPLQDEFLKMGMIVDDDTNENLKLHLTLSDYKGHLNDNIFEIQR